MMRARECGLVALAAALSVSSPAAATAGDVSAERGQALYKEQCESCHGRRGETKALGRSRRLADLDGAAVLAGLRGPKEATSPPRTTQARLKSGLSDDEVRSLAAYIATIGR